MVAVIAATARWSEVPDHDDQASMPAPTPSSAGCTVGLLAMPVVVVSYALLDWVVGWVR